MDEISVVRNAIEDKEVREAARIMLSGVLDYLDTEKPQELSDVCMAMAANKNYEKAAHALLEERGVVSSFPEKLLERAEIMYDQIAPHLSDGNVLDIGCGDARLAKLVAKGGKEVVLTDIYKNPNVANTGLRFELGQANSLSFAESEFNNALLLTVLHHSDNPLAVLREAYSVVRPEGRVVVIESVYGVDGKELSTRERKKAAAYLSLTKEQQRRLNVYFDHFYNRVIHYSDDPKMKVNVPFNFRTPQEWKSIFEENGFVQEYVGHLGIDQPAVPEYHTLHVLRTVK